MSPSFLPTVKDVVKGREDGSLLEVFGSGTVRVLDSP